MHLQVLNSPFGVPDECAFEGFLGDDSIPCPSSELYNVSFVGPRANLSLLNWPTKAYYFGLKSNCSQINLVFNIDAVCPNYCKGPGAWCSVIIGCYCDKDHYDPLTGCYLSGQCDPTSNVPTNCHIPNGYGNASCLVDTKTNITYYGTCKASGCRPGYYVDTLENICHHGTNPENENDKKWWRVGTLSKGASIAVWCTEALGVILAFSLAIYIVVRRRLNNSRYALLKHKHKHLKPDIEIEFVK